MSPANNIALKFYNNFKFEIIDKVDNYYKGMINKNPTAYILVLKLNIQ
jgi:ribosomal protein S18 acetylase RimI-like enzyme